MTVGKYKTQIRYRLQWYLMRLRGRNDYPKPCWYYPTDGWITDPQEIERAIRLDDDLTIAAPEQPKVGGR